MEKKIYHGCLYVSAKQMEHKKVGKKGNYEKKLVCEWTGE